MPDLIAELSPPAKLQPPDDSVRLAKELLASLDPHVSAVDLAWEQDIRKRVAEVPKWSEGWSSLFSPRPLSRRCAALFGGEADCVSPAGPDVSDLPIRLLTEMQPKHSGSFLAVKTMGIRSRAGGRPMTACKSAPVRSSACREKYGVQRLVVGGRSEEPLIFQR